MTDHAAQVRADRDRLVTAMLPHVPFDGWSAAGLTRAAQSLDMSVGEAGILFPEGARAAIAHFVDLADRLMAEDLAARDITKLKLREKVTLAVRLRLERWTPHREAVRRALIAMPVKAGPTVSVESLYRTVDAIWRAVGDRSHDFSFYTKRALLAGVYGSTLLVWLDDKSENSADTWAFLARRIDNVMQVPKLRARLEERLARLPIPLRLLRRARQHGAG
ncbi:MAG: COQ9 family protein [Rhodospirillaceae bacterium]|nr:COQ9 family protein [Rhodospirillaceae bacterium]